MTFIEYVSMLSTCLACMHAPPAPQRGGRFHNALSQQATNSRLRLRPVHGPRLRVSQEPPSPIASPTIYVNTEPQKAFLPTILEALTRQALLQPSPWPVPTHTVAPERFIPFLCQHGCLSPNNSRGDTESHLSRLAFGRGLPRAY